MHTLCFRSLLSYEKRKLHEFGDLRPRPHVDMKILIEINDFGVIFLTCKPYCLKILPCGLGLKGLV